MRFSTPTTASAGSGQLLLVCLLMSNFLGGSIAVPFGRNNDLQGRDVASVSINDPVHGTLDLEKRVGPPLIPKPRPNTPPGGGGRPGSPEGSPPPPPARPHDNPAEPNIPPPLTPDTAPPPPVRPGSPAKDPVPPLGSKDAPVNPGPKPDPDGPIPSEAEIAANYNVPPDKAIFWSQTKDDAYRYRDSNGLYTDTQAFPDRYTHTFKDRDIDKWLEFADRFSRVFAREAKGEVKVMVPWEKGPTPDRAFHSQEWPILKEGLASGRITKIIQINPKNFKETRVYDPTIYGLIKRSVDIDLNNVPWDVNLDALAEAWKRANSKEE